MIKLQTHSREVWNLTKPSILSCGNVTHGVDREPVNSVTKPKKKNGKSFHNQSQNNNWLFLKMAPVTNVIVLVTAIPVLESIRVSDADGAWVEPSATEALERPYSNAEDSKQENHSTLHAQLISELLIARDTHVIGEPKSALRVLTANSQML